MRAQLPVGSAWLPPPPPAVMFHPWTEGDARSEIPGEGMRVLEVGLQRWGWGSFHGRFSS